MTLNSPAILALLAFFPSPSSDQLVITADEREALALLSTSGVVRDGKANLSYTVAIGSPWSISLSRQEQKLEIGFVLDDYHAGIESVSVHKLLDTYSLDVNVKGHRLGGSEERGPCKDKAGDLSVNFSEDFEYVEVFQMQDDCNFLTIEFFREKDESKLK